MTKADQMVHVPEIFLESRRIKRVLICQLRQIGDVLLSTVPIQLLAKKFPGVEIHVMTEAKCAPILENNPDIAKVWPIDKRALDTLLKEVRYYWRVAREDFDIVVDFQQMPRCRWVVAFSRAPYRLSYQPPWYNRPLYTHTVRPLEGYAAMAKSSVLLPLGIHWGGERPKLVLTDMEQAWAQEYLAGLGVRGADKLISVDPTHRRPTREWPAASFGETMALAANTDHMIKFLLLFGPGEEQQVQNVLDQAREFGVPPERMILPERVLTLREMAACISRAALHFGNCSSPRHIAVAVGTPSFVVLGATSSSWTFPSPEHADIAANVFCQPCNKNSCPETVCLSALKSEKVAHLLIEHLDAHGNWI